LSHNLALSKPDLNIYLIEHEITLDIYASHQIEIQKTLSKMPHKRTFSLNAYFWKMVPKRGVKNYENVQKKLKTLNSTDELFPITKEDFQNYVNLKVNSGRINSRTLRQYVGEIKSHHMAKGGFWDQEFDSIIEEGEKSILLKDVIQESQNATDEPGNVHLDTSITSLPRRMQEGQTEQAYLQPYQSIDCASDVVTSLQTDNISHETFQNSTILVSNIVSDRQPYPLISVDNASTVATSQFTPTLNQISPPNIDQFVHPHDDTGAGASSPGQSVSVSDTNLIHNILNSLLPGQYQQYSSLLQHLQSDQFQQNNALLQSGQFQQNNALLQSATDTSNQIYRLEKELGDKRRELCELLLKVLSNQ
ncbi:1142_t:CDS:2, partial [Racocetra persica]